MVTGVRTIVLAAVVLAGFTVTAVSQTTPRQYEAFIRAEIAKCVADAVRLDKETGTRNPPTQAERAASCREMILQIHDLYPMPEPKPELNKKTRQPPR